MMSYTFRIMYIDFLTRNARLTVEYGSKYLKYLNLGVYGMAPFNDHWDDKFAGQKRLLEKYGIFK